MSTMMSLSVEPSMAAEVLQSIGAELVVFLITLVFAFGLKRIRDDREKGHPVGVAKSTATGQRTSPSGANTSPLSRSGSSRFVKQQAARDEIRCARHSSKEAAQMMDEVVALMRETASMKKANQVLVLYADLRKVFRERRFADVAACARSSPLEFYLIIVNSACRAGRAHMVEGILDEMARYGVPRPLDFYESTMKQLAGQKHYHLALGIYDRIVADNLEPSAVTCSCLISFAAEVGEHSRSLFFFNKLSSITTPSIRAYMTVLRVHAKRLDWQSTLSIYKDMGERGAPIDSLVLNVVLATGVATDQVEAAEELLQAAAALAVPIADLVSYNTLIKGYAQRSDGLKALEVLAGMRERRLVPNAITFNTVMDALVRDLRIAAAWELLDDMRASDLKPDKFTCSILVKGLSRGCTTEQVEACLALLEEAGGHCDCTLRSTLYHGVLDAATSLGDADLMLKAFIQMSQNRVVPTTASLRQLATALGQDMGSKRRAQMWNELLESNVRQSQPYLFNALLDAHLRQGEVAEAMKSFERLEQSAVTWGANQEVISMLEECRAAFLRSLCRMSMESDATKFYTQARSAGKIASVDCVTATALARVQAEAQNLGGAWATLEDMLDAGYRPNDGVLHTFLSSCVRQSHSMYGKALFERAQRANMTLSQTVCSLLIKLFTRCHQLQDAVAVMDDMIRRQGLNPPAPCVVPLLRTCFASRQPQKALGIVGLLQASQGSAPLDASIYKAVAAGCAAAGLTAKGAAVIEEARSRGVELPDDVLEVASSTSLCGRPSS